MKYKQSLKSTDYEPVIGLEVHVELNTKSKMFCQSGADYFGKEPNTHTCPICLGLPGALPYINKQAIEDCIKIGLALNCKVNKTSRFERKNYFYPDLPKGYQISQYRWPLTVDGWIEVSGKDGKKTKIRINRAHQEEDTGKLTHSGGETLIDYNRSSVPLVEVVTEPDFTQVEQIKDYAQKLQQIFRYLGVSNADMEKGDMRLEANVSVRDLSRHPRGGNVDLPNYRVELKNINSFRFMVVAVEYEVRRQIEALEKGEKLIQETRGWDEDKKITFIQRSKEEAHDYRYFPEPDLPEVAISDEEIEKIRMQLPELPQAREKRFIENLAVKEIDAKILANSKELADFFEVVLEEGNKHQVKSQEIANYIINKKPDISVVPPTQIIEEIKGKKVGVIDNEEELENLAKQSIEQNPKSVVDYQAGKLTAIQSLIGGIMKLSSGKADAGKAKTILEKLLNSY